MNANLAVIVDNLDYLLWGRLADGIPGGVVLTLLMAIGAAALALPVSDELSDAMRQCWRPSPGATTGSCGGCSSCGRRLFAASR